MSDRERTESNVSKSHRLSTAAVVLAVLLSSVFFCGGATADDPPPPLTRAQAWQNLSEAADASWAALDAANACLDALEQDPPDIQEARIQSLLVLSKLEFIQEKLDEVQERFPVGLTNAQKAALYGKMAEGYSSLSAAQTASESLSAACGGKGGDVLCDVEGAEPIPPAVQDLIDALEDAVEILGNVVECADWPDTEGYDTIANTEFEIIMFDPNDSTALLDTINAYGSCVIWRGPYDSNEGYMPTEMIELSATGSNPLLGGTFQISLDPDSISVGQIWPCDASCVYGQSWFQVSYEIYTTQPFPDDTLTGTAQMWLSPVCSGTAWRPMLYGRFTRPGGHGAAYQNPRKTPVYDKNGNIKGYVWHKHPLKEKPKPPFNPPWIHIACVDRVFQGLHQQVPVTLEDGDLPIGGYDLVIAYDASALALTAATPGQLHEECGWEYFNYRYGPFGNCGDACPSGMVRILSLAETNNGPNHPSCFLPDSLPATLFTLDFLVSDDRTLECQNVPIRFFWTDCGDNTVSSVDGEILYVSDHVYDFEGTEIADPTYHYPTYFGVQEECLNPDPDKPTAIQFVDFGAGCIDIICADSIDDRGDINLNGTPYEIADAVMFACYFVYGDACWILAPHGHIAASDVNADGITLSVADFVYLIRVITGDADPIPKLTPVTAGTDLVDGVLSVDGTMGAAYVVVDRNVTPTLLTESMEMKYDYDAELGLTRILIYSMEQGHNFSGNFLGGIEGNVITLEMATYDGTPVTTKLVPDEFALYPCYPNPFNPMTTISFALTSSVDYELVIYNALGQTVETFTGHSGPGLERIDWNATGYSSGVYFYRLTAGDFTDTRKMVLLK